jgi:kynurenine formamidase
MIIQTNYNDIEYTCDLSKPIDISIPLGNVKCFYATDFKKQPYVAGDFVGSVKKGAPVNFYDVELNPHGNGTHTECLGHITKKQECINDSLKKHHMMARLISVSLKAKGEDKIITLKNLKEACPAKLTEAIIIRTRPNYKYKLTKDYSGSNPPYLDKKAMSFLVKKGVKHLLIDLPSVDREEDKGKLASHHIFWNVKDHKAIDSSRKDCTITELIYVPNEVEDGMYLLNIQVAPIKLDASPSKPVLFRLSEMGENE